jgi:hypothetical protein
VSEIEEIKNFVAIDSHHNSLGNERNRMQPPKNTKLKDEVITPSNSKWNFPLIVVPKKTYASGRRKRRICTDFRKVNEVAIRDSYPLPNMQDIVDKLGRGRYFTALDCAGWYSQVAVDREETQNAISFAGGHLVCTRMPLRLKSSPSTFLRVMDSVLILGFSILLRAYQ